MPGGGDSLDSGFVYLDYVAGSEGPMMAEDHTAGAAGADRGPSAGRKLSAPRYEVIVDVRLQGVPDADAIDSVAFRYRSTSRVGSTTAHSSDSSDPTR